MDLPPPSEFDAVNSEEDLDFDDVTYSPSLTFRRPDSGGGHYESRLGRAGLRRRSSIEIDDIDRDSHNNNTSEYLEGLLDAGDDTTDPATFYADLAQYYGDVAEGELFLGGLVEPGESRPASPRLGSGVESSSTRYTGHGRGSVRLSSGSQRSAFLSAPLAPYSPPPEADATLPRLIEEAVANRLGQGQQQHQQHQSSSRRASELPLLHQRPRRVQAVAMDQQQPRQGQPTVIDLTEEPDSPVLQQRAVRIPRQQEQSRRITGLQPTVIDLTNDSSDAHPRHQGDANTSSPEYIEVMPARLRRAQPNDIELQLNFGLSQFARNRLPSLSNFFPFHRQSQNRNPHTHIRNGRRIRGGSQDNYFIHGRQPVEVDFEIRGQHYLPVNPLRGNLPELNYQMNGILQVPRLTGNMDQPLHSPPPHIPPPPAREGFTRDTGDEVVAVCASCDEELMYDPDGGGDDPPAKRARTRKEREEHHFWAVTACGHVYCRRCFENRRSKDPALGFASDGKATFCAVEGCQTDVTLKKAWVGLFL